MVLDGAGIKSGQGPQFIDFGNGSNLVHDHLDFDLVDDSSPFGAYGIMFQLQSDFDVATSRF